MPDTASYSFPPFRFDGENDVLWRETTLIPLRPKTVAVLHYLLTHAGQVVSREATLQAVWGQTKVSPQVLRASLWELRHALGDEAKTPRFIETVAGRGWRFIAPLTTTPPVPSPKSQVLSSNTQHSTFSSQHSLLVGREAELAQLHRYWEKAVNGERQIIFVTGEPGIGKTALVDAFLKRVRYWEFDAEASPSLSPAPTSQLLTPGVWVAVGQCIEQYGPGEAYMPVLEALDQLCHRQENGTLLTLLRRYAPLWLAQIPALLEPAELASLQQQLAGTTRERMLREFATLADHLTIETPLVLVLEDLHWADASTISLLSSLARRHEAARLLIIGTYRPEALRSSTIPLAETVRELRIHQQCAEMRLEGFHLAEIEAYLRQRFPTAVLPVRLPALLQQRTEGHPFFLVSVIDEWIARGTGAAEKHLGQPWQETLMALQTQIPQSLEQFFEQRRAQVGVAEQELLATASVVGLEFSSALVAAVVDTAVATVEERCEQLVQAHLFLQRAGVTAWPDGTQAARYRFQHALYQQLWHERVAINRRPQWHQKVGERLERAYGERVGEVATELAVHFEEGRDYQRAIQYHGKAAEQAGSRHAYQESITHLTAALQLLRTFPDTPERDLQEIGLQLSLSLSLGRTQAVMAPEFDQILARQWTLSQRLPESPHLFWPLVITASGHVTRGELRKSHVVIERCWQLAQRFQERSFFTVAFLLKGSANFLAGDLTTAMHFLEQGMALYALPQVDRSLGWDYGLGSFSYAALALWQLGYPDQAVQKATKALPIAYARQFSYMEVFTRAFLSRVHQLRGECAVAQQHAWQTVEHADEQGFTEMRVLGHIFHRWALIEHEATKDGVPQFHHAITLYRTNSGEAHRSYYLSLLAEAYAHTKQRTEGLAMLDEALKHVECTGERYWEAELYRLKGEFLLQTGSREWGPGVESSSPQTPHLKPQVPSGAEEETEGYFLKAIEIAQKQQAKSLELRAVMSLARLWQQQDKTTQAHTMLSEVYHWFTEGFDTKDLQEAKVLLEALKS